MARVGYGWLTLFWTIFELSPIRLAEILVIMSVSTFKTAAILYVLIGGGNISSHWLKYFTEKQCDILNDNILYL